MCRVKSKVVLNPKRAIGYVRVSTEEQSLGPEVQRRAIESWCAREGIELVAGFEDIGKSGALEVEARAGLRSACEALVTQDAGVLVAMKRDRFARDMVVIAMIERLAERDGAVVRTTDGMVGDNPEAKLMRGMIDLFAWFERALIRSRTKAALAVKHSRNERVGAVRYGWRPVAGGAVSKRGQVIQLEEDPGEQAVIEKARLLRAGGLSYDKIGVALMEAGMLPRKEGGKWHAQLIRRLVMVKGDAK